MTNITTALEQFISAPSLRTCDDSDDNQSIETVLACNTIIEENILFLNPSASDPSDYANANVSSMTSSTLETIVEVVNPILVGDGTANEIAVSRMLNDDLSLPSFDVDDEEHEQLSLNDKMKNVLKELKENEKVRLSWSRSMEEDDDVEMPEASASPTYEEKTGSIGTVFMVRERLINDFYDHEQSSVNQENIDSCQVFSNPSVDEFLAHEIRHAQAATETLTLDLRSNDDDNEDEDETSTDNTPTSPTKTLASDLANLAATTAGANKKRRRNKKSKAKK